jgi:hypothetical protein
MGFEPTILVFERPNTFHALDRAATKTCEQAQKNRNYINEVKIRLNSSNVCYHLNHIITYHLKI